MNIKASEIIHHFENENVDDIDYLDFHKLRYIYLLQNIADSINVQNKNESIRILDIGPAYQTSLIREYFPSAIVDTLGFDHPSNVLRAEESHHNQDLNDTSKRWEVEGNNYHVILFCEVIEHLYTKPELCVEKLKSALIENGRIIIQTPNAVAIHKRFKLLFGLNPYNLLEESKMGHFREYTSKELRMILENVGLSFESVELKNYFNSKTSVLNRAFVKLGPVIPKSFRDGITIVGINSAKS